MLGYKQELHAINIPPPMDIYELINDSNVVITDELNRFILFCIIKN